MRWMEGARLPLAPLQPYPSRSTDTHRREGWHGVGRTVALPFPAGRRAPGLAAWPGHLHQRPTYLWLCPGRGERLQAAGSLNPRESPGAAFLRLQALARDQVQAPGAEARWNHPRTNFLTKDSPHLTISFPSATALTCCLFQTVSSRGLALSLSIFYSGEGSDTCLRT